MVANVSGEKRRFGFTRFVAITLETLLAFKAFSHLVVFSSLSAGLADQLLLPSDGSAGCPRSAPPPAEVALVSESPALGLQLSPVCCRPWRRTR